MPYKMIQKDISVRLGFKIKNTMKCIPPQLFTSTALILISQYDQAPVCDHVVLVSNLCLLEL